uniref:Intimal thickness related receptor IRP domain-containing protein n=1 Tax=Chromera velia CCMP2878 TaxID=1169474 RepID=A0A0G4H5I7_9ALVE|eukprot:Cvel_24766.t1-p1 / transcript=Cvel_24766.t1 / gene=Cvel_24766 / organism=Chromera_velia_CCMP2878 / gene_product=Sensory rhodopsin-2, putative / transcript_product=Sensory rhodopsin-2, putative / location=Cvel_scaffold2722:22244-24150(-) / protein_length=423 / sequence_SO=supercontig / SO=protein_coding / is_pseudo=false
MMRNRLLSTVLFLAAVLLPCIEATRDFLAECIAKDAIEGMSNVTRGVRIAQATLFFIIGVFYWTRFPDPHLKDQRLAVFSLCTSLNGYIMLFSACHNLIMLSQADDVIYEDCTRTDIGRYIQFAVTCPLLSWQVSLLARSNRQRQIEMVLSTFLLLILGVWVNAIPEFSYRMMAFGLTFFFFILLVVNLDWAVRETSENAESLFKGNSHMRYICLCVVVTWVTFPITWFIGPAGVAAVPRQAETIILSVMDLASKLAFSGYVYYVRKKWTATLRKEVEEEEQARQNGTAEDFARHRKRKMSFVTGQPRVGDDLEELRQETALVQQNTDGLSPSKKSPNRVVPRAIVAEPQQQVAAPQTPSIVIANCFDANSLAQAIGGRSPASAFFPGQRAATTGGHSQRANANGFVQLEEDDLPEEGSADMV